MSYSLIGKIRVSFIDSDLLYIYRGALSDRVDYTFTIWIQSAYKFVHSRCGFKGGGAPGARPPP